MYQYQFMGKGQHLVISFELNAFPHFITTQNTNEEFVMNSYLAPKFIWNKYLKSINLCPLF